MTGPSTERRLDRCGAYQDVLRHTVLGARAPEDAGDSCGKRCLRVQDESVGYQGRRSPLLTNCRRVKGHLNFGNETRMSSSISAVLIGVAVVAGVEPDHSAGRLHGATPKDAKDGVAIRSVVAGD